MTDAEPTPLSAAQHLVNYEDLAASAAETLGYAEDNCHYGSPEQAHAMAHASVVAQLASAAATAALAAAQMAFPTAAGAVHRSPIQMPTSPAPATAPSPAKSLRRRP